MSPRPRKTPVALTIAGSDSGGGAGIQADLKTFSQLGVFGTSAITCLTAQNPKEVSGVAPTKRGFVNRQIIAVCSAFPVVAAKTGMLLSSSIIRETMRSLRSVKVPLLVVDPVARATSGSALLKHSAERVLINELIPMASVITPNIPEAEMILAEEIRDADAQIDAARAISHGFGNACILKGGHMKGNVMLDVLCSNGRIYTARTPRIEAKETHGTGCTLSAAVTACLARGMSLPAAFRKACSFVQGALKHPLRTGNHFPLAP